MTEQHMTYMPCKDGKTRKTWSPQAVEFVRENIATKGAKWCASELQVPVMSIYNMRHHHILPLSARGGKQAKAKSVNVDAFFHALRRPLEVA